jgi:hypothetical protein
LNWVTATGRGRPQKLLKVKLVNTPAERNSVTSRKAIVRPDIISGRFGRISFTTSAMIAGKARAQAMTIAPSRATPANALNFAGNDREASS